MSGDPKHNEPSLIMFSSDSDVPTSRRPEAVGYVPEQVDAAELIERLRKLNRKQRRSIIARARKQARSNK